ncbi:hypothetical protein EV648_105243 [Kribbella sp. VKM Ac-2568]|nr:hypothetical protein EV648_105243 [Kribbella sp. VKM Ac-2568]
MDAPVEGAVVGVGSEAGAELGAELGTELGSELGSVVGTEVGAEVEAGLAGVGDEEEVLATGVSAALSLPRVPKRNSSPPTIATAASTATRDERTWPRSSFERRR